MSGTIRNIESYDKRLPSMSREIRGIKQITRLMVDGYNMIGAWSSLQQTKRQAGFESARRELIEVLANYSARKGLDTRIVFDAHLVNSPSSEETVTPNLTVCYTAFGQTADSYIEKICARLFSNPLRSGRIIVATSDRTHRLTVSGYGAECISAKQLHRDVQLSSQGNQYSRSQRLRPSHRSLLQGLDDEAREKLTRLRFGSR
jgi:predicted RNA-binding protein with PIN domain